MKEEPFNDWWYKQGGSEKWGEAVENSTAEAIRMVFMEGKKEGARGLMKLYHSGTTAGYGEPCNHGNYTFKEHGRICPCGVIMFDPGD